MNNPSSLGNPIPTAVITPTEILSPVQVAADSFQSAMPDENEQSDLLPLATQVFAGVMFAPFAFWSSMTASYLRFFDLSDRGQSSTYHLG